MRFAIYRSPAAALLVLGAAAAGTAQPPAALDKLKANTTALANERAAAETSSAERAKLQDDLRRLIERLDKAPLQPPANPNPNVIGGPPKTTKEPGPAITALPVDRLRAAINLVRDNQIESALNAFRQLNLQQLDAEDRAFAQFMTASCLRRLGRTAEALPIYREVGDAGEEPFIASSAVSQVALIRNSEELQAQLIKLRERPKAR